MSLDAISPGLVLIGGAFLIPVCRGALRQAVVIGLPLLTLVLAGDEAGGARPQMLETWQRWASDVRGRGLP